MNMPILTIFIKLVLLWYTKMVRPYTIYKNIRRYFMLSNNESEIFNIFSLKKVDEKMNDATDDLTKKQPPILPFQQLETTFKQLPQEIIGATNGINDVITNMNSLLQDTSIKNMLQNINQVIKKTNQETNQPKWKLIELDEEHIIYVELDNTSKDNISLDIVDHIVTIVIKQQSINSDIEEKTITHSITLPYKIDAADVKAYFSPTLIDIHIPKKNASNIPLLDRTPNRDK